MQTTETKTGIDVLREALRVRFKRGPIVVGIFARELGIGVGTLEDFANNRAATLPAQTLDAAAKFVFGDNVSFDAERNLLRRTKQPSTGCPGRTPGRPARQPAHGAVDWSPNKGVPYTPPPKPPGGQRTEYLARRAMED